VLGLGIAAASLRLDRRAAPQALAVACH